MTLSNPVAPHLTTAAGPPRLSIVACSRNDDHGGDLLKRMQVFVDGIADQAERFALECELILVDWNPPADRPGLAEVLSYPDGGGHLISRIVVVPPTIHGRLPHSEALPLFQMIAKNVGIRRALGRMVLSTNIDILFPDAFVRWMAEGAVNEGLLYRADRADILARFGNDEVGDLGALRSVQPLRVNRHDGTYDAEGHRVVPLYSSLWDLVAYRWGQSRHPDRPRQIRPAQPEVAAASPLRRAAVTARKGWRLATLPKPHLNACGDFTLMSRQNWLRLGGHAEWPMYSWNLDGLLLYQAMAHGIAIVDLPAEFTVRHMDHSRGSGWTPEGAGDLFARMSSRNIPVLTNDMIAREVQRLGLSGMRTPRPRTYNDDDWGYARERLPEVTFQRSADSRR
jgi:hypothetical protein